MKLLGDWNWWLPRPLRWLPEFRHEPVADPGRGGRPCLIPPHTQPLAVTAWPADPAGHAPFRGILWLSQGA